MSDLSRPSIHNQKGTAMKKGSKSPSSPMRKTRNTNKEISEYSEDKLDSSINSDIEDECDDINKSSRVKKHQKPRQNLYPDLSKETEESKQDVRKRKTEKNTSYKGGSDDSKSPRDDTKIQSSKPEQKQDQDSFMNIWIFIAVVVVIVGLGFVFTQTDSDEKISKSVDMFQLFKKDYEHLKPQFPQQSERFWKIILSQIKRILTQDSPTYPAIVLLVVPNRQSNMGACLTKKIVQSINSIQSVSGDFFIDTSELDLSTPGKTKIHMDQKMHRALNSSRTVVLDHIENLPGEAALLLHAFCDGDNAPYKKAVIFLVLHSDMNFSDMEMQHDEVVEDILIDLWQSSLGEDEMPALQSRIANNIAVMKPETINGCK